ncbi:MAG: VanW family protein [Candidatus Limnocylindrales bacterium]
MTTTTPETIAIPADSGHRPSGRLRFGVAFLVGLMVALLVGVGAIYAYDQQYVGRVLPGVRVGSVDLSGLDPVVAADRLRAEYAALSEGEIVLDGPEGPITVPYEAVGRRADVEAMVADAMAVGRAGNPVERAIADARTALRGVTLVPRVTFDADLVAELIATPVDRLAKRPLEARVTRTEDGGFVIVPGRDGRKADAAPAITAALAALGGLDAPKRLELQVPVVAVPPAVSTVEAFNARAQADRLTAQIVLAIEDVEKPQSIAAAQLREWTSFAPTADGGYAPSIDTSELPAVLKKLAKKVDQAPVNASFTTKGGAITGVTKSQRGYKMDQAATASLVETVLADRAAGAVAPAVQPALKVTEPTLTTAGAEAARPKMKLISKWTTYFPISIKNGFGANIWIPARLIDGYVVAPRGKFDFWDAIGPVTRAKGYKDGGAIINGRTEPQGALAGGICSCSTTLFNAALRAGYEMGARRNHYYYIDRYPLGLDATVFISASGSKQTMSFTNDTDYPLLIRGFGYRKGSAGYVRFEIYSVPTGRKVSIATSSRRNFRAASETVQYTSRLAPGVRERIEYPVDGFQVTAVRTVRDRDGKVIHKDTYFSNYSRVNGITLIGKAAD